MDANTFVSRLLSSGLASPETIVPCSLSEVAYLQSSVKDILPQDYLGFLLSAGKCAGQFLADYDCFYPEILRNQSVAEEKLETWEEGLVLPDGAFVFAYRPGEQFWFFSCFDKLTPVSCYYEGRGEFTRVASGFWDFIDQNLEISIELRLRNVQSEFWPKLDAIAHRRAVMVKQLGIPPSF